MPNKNKYVDLKSNDVNNKYYYDYEKTDKEIKDEFLDAISFLKKFNDKLLKLLKTTKIKK